VLASAIGFTFSLTFATQGILGSVTEYQRMLGSVRRWAAFTVTLQVLKRRWPWEHEVEAQIWHSIPEAAEIGGAES
jgi:hypothetical protein